MTEPTQIVIEDEIYLALDAGPKTISELATAVDMNRFVLWGSYLKFMVAAGIVIKLPCGRLALPESCGPSGGVA